VELHGESGYRGESTSRLIKGEYSDCIRETEWLYMCTGCTLHGWDRLRRGRLLRDRGEGIVTDWRRRRDPLDSSALASARSLVLDAYPLAAGYSTRTVSLPANSRGPRGSSAPRCTAPSASSSSHRFNSPLMSLQYRSAHRCMLPSFLLLLRHQRAGAQGKGRGRGGIPSEKSRCWMQHRYNASRGAACAPTTAYQMSVLRHQNLDRVLYVGATRHGPCRRTEGTTPPCPGPKQVPVSHRLLGAVMR
jgi:hypothetical protein